MKRSLATEIAEGLNTQHERPSCPKCGSSNVLARKADSFCRRCGHSWVRGQKSGIELQREAVAKRKAK